MRLEKKKIMKSFTFKSNLVKKSFTAHADCVQDAASQAKNHFLGVVARREFGRKGFCRVSKWVSSDRVEAFIGTPAQGGGCSGRSIVMDVDLVD